MTENSTPPAIPDQPAEGEAAWHERCARQREIEAAVHAEAVRWSKELGMGNNISEPASDLITVRDHFQQVQQDLNDTLEELETRTEERDRARDQSQQKLANHRAFLVEAIRNAKAEEEHYDAAGIPEMGTRYVHEANAFGSALRALDGDEGEQP